jgi:hypothetical protein
MLQRTTDTHAKLRRARTHVLTRDTHPRPPGAPVALGPALSESPRGLAGPQSLSSAKCISIRTFVPVNALIFVFLRQEM